MSKFANVEDYLTRYPSLGASLYAIMIGMFAYMIASSVQDIIDHRRDVAEAASLLGKFENRKALSSLSTDVNVSGPNGSPLIEGATVTVAGAALLQRVSGTITRFGGKVLSSQIEPSAGRSTVDFISVSITGEIEQQNGLQNSLYDLEAGMPFLFVDHLEIQAEADPMASANARLRFSLGVSGRWHGAE